MSQLVAVSKEDLEEMVQEMVESRVQAQVEAQLERILEERGLAARPGGARGPRPWSRVRAEIQARLKLAPGKDSDRYQALAAAALVIRRALVLSHIRHIPPEREAEALEVGHAVPDLMRAPRTRDAENAEAGSGAAEAEE